MSDDDETSQQGWAKQRLTKKKPRLSNACDTCRRKKIKCDSASMPGNECSNCYAFNIPCTHSQPTKKRGPKSPHVEGLEKRVKVLESIIRKLSPNVSLEELEKNEHLIGNSLISSSPLISNSIPVQVSSPESLSSDSPAAVNVKEEPEEDDFTYIELSRRLKEMHLLNGMDRFFGPSSGFMLLHKAHSSKAEFLGKEMTLGERLYKRHDYWVPQPWEHELFSHQEIPPLEFPENDLLVSLISLYFAKINVFLPILHAPTFKKSIYEGLHLLDSGFAQVVLGVCALGSRFSDDKRVCFDSRTRFSAGWKWYRQVKLFKNNIGVDRTTLYELQSCCLSAIYLMGTSQPQAAWAPVGLAIRMSQELGLHRRRPGGYKLTTEYEQLKRVFWVLVTLDWMVSNFTGRPCVMSDAEYDQDLPAECDDLYWENSNPNLAFTQPPNTPSSLSCFIYYIKLCEILAYSMKTLYSNRKAKLMMGWGGAQWEQRVMSELDSALNDWINSLPEHLQWDPHREDPLFFSQSVFLHTLYHHVRIQTHRPFIQKSSPLTFASLAMCTNSARSCINVLHQHFQRESYICVPHIFYASFISGIVLLTNIWACKCSGLKVDEAREMRDVRKVLGILNVIDKRWMAAGRFTDILCELARGLKPDCSECADASDSPSEGSEASENDPTVPQSSRPVINQVHDTVSKQIISAQLPWPTQPSSFGNILVQDPNFVHPKSQLAAPPTIVPQFIPSTMRIPSDMQSDIQYDSIPAQLPADSLAWGFEDQNMDLIWSSAPDGFSIEDLEAYMNSVNAAIGSTPNTGF